MTEWNLFSNPALQAMVLAVAGALGYWLKDIPGQLFSWFKQYVVSTLTVDSRDEFLFGALTEFLDRHPSAQRLNNVKVHSARRGSEFRTLEEELRTGHSPLAFYSPAEGLHFMRLQGRLLWIQRDMQFAQVVYERIRISCFGRLPTRLQALMQNAIEQRTARETDLLSVYIPNPFDGSGWMHARLGTLRPLSSVVLKAGQAEGLLADLQRFISHRGQYEKLGIPWRRGYLLYGPPGTGKTSLVIALASELQRNVCTMSLASPIVTDEKIHVLLASVPKRSILLLEDIDAFFHDREAVHDEVRLSFSGFLNALDGVATQEGTILFMTTNHVDKLDAALIRAGRIDEKIELGYADHDQLRRLYLKFDDDEAAAQAFATQHAKKKIAPAQAQGLLLAMMKDKAE
ncbi:AAA family ATPase [Ottowia testudinis]|uniref:AAA family ATPase n=1 Tax=Ottowia testudinis TaxID=2816950 RepID=A0A975H1E3_9BURK|nr:AAA family ATPase [Ottowia testudinis]QTD43743.1 AAA family ATPase [Ottowia testudinis]